jgi:hypothetical protein
VVGRGKGWYLLQDKHFHLNELFVNQRNGTGSLLIGKVQIMQVLRWRWIRKRKEMLAWHR